MDLEATKQDCKHSALLFEKEQRYNIGRKNPRDIIDEIGLPEEEGNAHKVTCLMHFMMISINIGEQVLFMQYGEWPILLSPISCAFQCLLFHVLR